MSESPDFDLIEHLLIQSRMGIGAAELHGCLSAQLCFEADLEPDRWLAESTGSSVAMFELDPDLRQHLTWLFDWTAQLLADRELAFGLLLPDDEQPLEQRAAAFAQWCGGYVAAVGTLAGDLTGLPDEAREYVLDLVELSRAGFDGNDEEEDDEEAGFVDLVEYVRLGAMMMFETLRAPDPDETLH